MGVADASLTASTLDDFRFGIGSEVFSHLNAWARACRTTTRVG